jgi:Protein of unknown function (DUF3108)
MRSFFFIFLVAFLSFSFRPFSPSGHFNFEIGEKYSYKIKYGFITIGGADVEMDEKIYAVNNQPCFKVNVIGRTAGMTDMFKVRNTYRSYIDTISFAPQRFLYSAREQNYKRDQVILFNHQSHVATKTEKENSKNFKVPQNIHDVISGYYLLRTIDFSKFSIGQSISAPLFFDEDIYQMKVKFAGRGRIHTKFGKINVLKLNPILPQNKLFKGENAIRIWVSDDKNRVPVKIEADFFIGTIEMELKTYDGVKYPFNWL